MLKIPGYEVLDLLHNSLHTLVYKARRSSDQMAVVIKTPAGELGSPQQYQRYRQEFELGLMVNDVHVVRYLELVGEQTPALIIEDFGGISLDRFPHGRGMELTAFLKVALQLAWALAAVHQRNLVHKDLKPANIVYEPEKGVAKLIDFGIASQLNNERENCLSPKGLEGTLQYISPEQTGRMNRAMDYRTDFYSLGVTLYELLTGVCPFESEDALELIHWHIARMPVPPHLARPGLPEMLSIIVMRLLAKNAEDRYQSGPGLGSDLERCLREIQQSGQISIFEPGTRDQSDKFSIPQKLYGREHECRQLLEGFERVSQGERHVLTVTGFAGIGKSSLVNEVRKPITRTRGYFISGKFDQLERNMAYSALAMAFQDLVQQILGQSDPQIALWRGELAQALGPNGRVLTEIIPQLETLIGVQPELAPLGPRESEQRFKATFRDFLRVCASEDHPLVLFLDDLHWADTATLNLVRYLFEDCQISYVYLLGAFRDNEVSEGSLLSITLENLGRNGVILSHIHLRPLTSNELIPMLEETLHRDPQAVRSLADLILRKTNGNPFFTHELLRNLHRKKEIFFDHESGLWQWDFDRIGHEKASDNVVSFLLERLEKLPEQTRNALERGACFGNRFFLEDLCDLMGRSPAETARFLWPAIKEELLEPLDSQYKLVQLQEERLVQDSMGVRYRFQHDRIQQVAYSLLEEANRPAVHLAIGRMLRKKYRDQVSEKTVEIANHMNQGLQLLSDPLELESLAKLNLDAANRARLSIAYEAASGFLQAGLACLQDNPWENNFSLCFQLTRAQAEIACLRGQRAECQEYCHALLVQARTAEEKADIYLIELTMLLSLNENTEAIEVGCRGLHLLGINLKNPVPKSVIFLSIARVRSRLLFTNIQSLLDREDIGLKRINLALTLLTGMTLAAYFSGNRNLFTLTIMTRMSLVLKFGNGPTAAHTFAAFGMLAHRMGQLQEAFDFGKLALELNHRYPLSSLTCRTLFITGFSILPWHIHWREIESYLEKSVELGLQTGDLFYTAMAAAYVSTVHPTRNLKESCDISAHYLEITRDTKVTGMIETARLNHQYMRCLLGQTWGNCLLSDSHFDEEQSLANMKLMGFSSGIATWNLCRAKLCFLDGRRPEALPLIEQVELHVSSIGSIPPIAECVFVGYLIRAACLESLMPLEVKKHRRIMNRYLRKMKKWAVNCPLNFRHKLLLMQAEQARLAGNDFRAVNLYEKALEQAGQVGFLRDEALINEAAMLYHESKGRRKLAELHLVEAIYGFSRWGALTKVRQLEESHGDLLVHLSPRIASNNPLATGGDSNFLPNDRLTLSLNDDGNTDARLDLKTIIKSAMAISGEIDYQKLLATMMQIIIETAGAQNATLFLEIEGALQGKASIHEGRVEIFQGQPLEDYLQACITIVRYVFRSGENLVLPNASDEGRFTQDSYIRSRQVRSILCLPIRQKDRIQGVLYLENNLTTNAFTGKRVVLLQLLVSQAAVSLENARLFTDTLQAEARVRELNQNLASLNEELEERVQQRTLQLEMAQKELVAKAHKAGMADIAASVLHNVGNILNSVITSSSLIKRTIETSKVQGLARANQLLRANIDNLADFIARDPRGMDLMRYYLGLDKHLVDDGKILLKNTDRLIEKINSIRDVIMDQQLYASGGFQNEALSLEPLIEESINTMTSVLARREVSLIRDYQASPHLFVQKYKLMHVMINLIKNAAEAVANLPEGQGEIIIRIWEEAEMACVSVADNGVGIASEGLDQIFQFGVTSKENGHGFGLHSCANALTEMGGTIRVQSGGLNQGSVFTLMIPKQNAR